MSDEEKTNGSEDNHESKTETLIENAELRFYKF